MSIFYRGKSPSVHLNLSDDTNKTSDDLPVTPVIDITATSIDEARSNGDILQNLVEPSAISVNSPETTLVNNTDTATGCQNAPQPSTDGVSGATAADPSSKHPAITHIALLNDKAAIDNNTPIDPPCAPSSAATETIHSDSAEAADEMETGRSSDDVEMNDAPENDSQGE